MKRLLVGVVWVGLGLVASGAAQASDGYCGYSRYEYSHYRAPVVEIFENLQPLLNDLVAFLALDVGDEADAAGVMLVLRVVQTLRGGDRRRRLLVVVHGDTVCEGPIGR